MGLLDLAREGPAVIDTDLAALLRAAKEQPDDLPRFALADWLEEHGDAERAAFVRLQCELARLAWDERSAGLLVHDSPLRLALVRERDLLQAHGGRWLSGLWQFTQGWGCHRGLLFLQISSLDAFLHQKGQAETRSAAFCWVAGLQCPVSFGSGDRLMGRFLRQTDALSGLSHLQLRVHCDRGLLCEFVRSAHLGLLSHLDLVACDVGDEGVEALAGSPHLHRLRTLGLASCGVTDAGIAKLARSPFLGRLERLSLRGNPISDQGAELLAGMKSLREIDVFDQYPMESHLSPAGQEVLQSRFGKGCGFLDLSTPFWDWSGRDR
jgi:uncharacterized protein (TIGR02996 family)